MLFESAVTKAPEDQFLWSKALYISILSRKVRNSTRIPIYGFGEEITDLIACFLLQCCFVEYAGINVFSERQPYLCFSLYFTVTR